MSTLTKLQLLPFVFVSFFLLFLVYNGQAQTNNLLTFDGIDDQVNVANPSNVLDFTTGTVEAWIKPGAYNANKVILAMRTNTGTRWSIHVNQASGTIGLWNGSSFNTVSYTIQSGVWYHIAVVLSAASTTVYVNGLLVGNTGNVMNAAVAGKPLVIGSPNDNVVSGEWFTGAIDEVRIWNTALTQTEIKATIFKSPASNASGLLAYYSFNDGSGLTLTNSATGTSGTDGTLANGPVWSASPIQFTPNAVQFDQVDDKVLAPVLSTATSNITMEAWVYHNGGTGTDHVLMTNGVVGSNGYTLFINTSHRLIVIFGGVNTWNTNIDLPANQWTHIALVINTTGFILYKDGVNVYSNTGVPLTPTTNFTIGFNNGVGQPFDGSIDEVRFWNSARTQTEIQANMNHEIDPATAGLASYYTFNQGITAGDNNGLVTIIDQTGTNNGTLTNFALNGTASNYVAQFNSLIVLPLQWLSFTAKKQKRDVLLEWSTAAEQNTKDFVIEHSMDGRNWSGIGTVAAATNGASINNYSWTHQTPGEGANYYRILQRDIDNRFSYSEIKIINFQLAGPDTRVMANPVTNGTLQLQVSSPGAQVVTLFSAEGKLLLQLRLGTGTHDINVSRYPAGLYFLKAGPTVTRILLR